eukprot:CAMPEP_0195574554 /NCGR_PEP_ID=MMETSP0814-20130614/6023_1 /TAXON_ID=97485 /ORGANISM="Prymnesium parvum, Strain Texoma1" /LENGTH=111 /DNA_ID=CAMNT_0040710561 /DNA_START=161 /DNA_END=497 /DNA_ORIENTATION=+
MDRSHDGGAVRALLDPPACRGGVATGFWSTLLRGRAPTDAPDGCVDHGELAPCEEPREQLGADEHEDPDRRGEHHPQARRQLEGPQRGEARELQPREHEDRRAAEDEERAL